MKRRWMLLTMAILIIMGNALPVFAMPLKYEEPDFVNYVNAYSESDKVLINGLEHQMSSPTYFSEESGSLMVPIRNICIALGLEDSAVKWDAEYAIVTIDAGKRIIQFQVGASYYYVNKVMVPIFNDDGEHALTEISEGRAYVPYRVLAEALKITVEWNEDVTGFVYNAPPKV